MLASLSESMNGKACEWLRCHGHTLLLQLRVCASLLHKGRPHVVMLAGCEQKIVRASQNATSPASTICVPMGAAPPTPVTADVVEGYNACFDVVELARPENCTAIMRTFEQATGCGEACLIEYDYTEERVQAFCSGLPEAECGRTVAPCDIDTARTPASAVRATSPSEADVTADAMASDPVGAAANTGGGVSSRGGGGSSGDNGGGGTPNLGAIIGGVVGGIVALALLSTIKLLSVRKKRKGASEVNATSTGKAPLDATTAESGTQRRQPDKAGPWSEHISTAKNPREQWQGGPALWGPAGAYTNAPQHVPESKLSLHSARTSSCGAAWPAGNTTLGSHSGEHDSMQSTPAKSIKVTWSSSKDTFDVTTHSSLGSMQQSSRVPSQNGAMSPAQILDAQLDYLEQMQRGMLTRTIQCATLNSTSALRSLIDDSMMCAGRCCNLCK